eukprot:scaffold3045_cov225-Prasinococcus_capsulatus_cf.AAC.3
MQGCTPPQLLVRAAGPADSLACGAAPSRVGRPWLPRQARGVAACWTDTAACCPDRPPRGARRILASAWGVGGPPCLQHRVRSACRPHASSCCSLADCLAASSVQGVRGVGKRAWHAIQGTANLSRPAMAIWRPPARRTRPKDVGSM